MKIDQRRSGRPLPPTTYETARAFGTAMLKLAEGRALEHDSRLLDLITEVESRLRVVESRLGVRQTNP